MNVNTKVLRERIDAAFDAEDLDNFCYDHFRSVKNQFTVGQTKTARIQKLIEYAERNGEIEKLLGAIKEANPYQYNQFQTLDQSLCLAEWQARERLNDNYDDQYPGVILKKLLDGLRKLDQQQLKAGTASDRLQELEEQFKIGVENIATYFQDLQFDDTAEQYKKFTIEHDIVRRADKLKELKNRYDMKSENINALIADYENPSLANIEKLHIKRRTNKEEDERDKLDKDMVSLENEIKQIKFQNKREQLEKQMEEIIKKLEGYS
ncbi:hypothetical protein QUF75_09340 [Desulfococcaceae bacterium HSG7]|nr:hypothetical protein [Desulfococcaceae bacterium HSG7]